MNTTNAVTIFSVAQDPFSYNVNISQSNINSDTDGFVFITGPSLGEIKFCTRVSTWEGSVQVAFRETNFLLTYNLTENNFSLVNIVIDENDADIFETDVDTGFTVQACQCENHECIAPRAIEQNKAIIMCLQPKHPEGIQNVVHISNFDMKMYAGNVEHADYVEYAPVVMGDDGWDNDPLTVVVESSGVVMISTPVTAQFFIQGHERVDVSGNCFLEFNAGKASRARNFNEFVMIVDLEVDTRQGCLLTFYKTMLDKCF